MTTNNQRHAGKEPIWKRVFAFVRAYEDASQYSPTERIVIDLNRRVADLEDAIQTIEQNAH